MSSRFDDPNRPQSTRDPRPISPFNDSVPWSSTRPRPMPAAIAPTGPAPIARVGLRRAEPTDATAPRMTMFQEKP